MFTADSSNKINKACSFDYSVALAGNPNVGKSTIFNALTGLKQHTGNWTGKTVECAFGAFKFKDKVFKITDLPGTYSITSFSEEEKVSRDFLLNNKPDCTVIVADSNALERNLVYVLQVLSIQQNAVLCLNLYDEALRHNIEIDIDELSLHLGIPVICTCATKSRGLSELRKTVYDICDGNRKCYRVARNFEGVDINDISNHKKNTELLALKSKEISERCILKNSNTINKRRFKADKILTSKAVGIPLMLLLFGILFWITTVGANYPSEWLSSLFGVIKNYLYSVFEFFNVQKFLTGIIIDGVYTTLSWVVSVMLPPMAIFFPLFSIIEDSGYLPRIAFNLDKYFSKCGAHGKQSLTMWCVAWCMNQFF